MSYHIQFGSIFNELDRHISNCSLSDQALIIKFDSRNSNTLLRTLDLFRYKCLTSPATIVIDNSHVQATLQSVLIDYSNGDTVVTATFLTGA